MVATEPSADMLTLDGSNDTSENVNYRDGTPPSRSNLYGDRNIHVIFRSKEDIAPSKEYTHWVFHLERLSKWVTSSTWWWRWWVVQNSMMFLQF